MSKDSRRLKLPQGQRPNYDKVAPFYDKLSRLIFGNAILQAHLFLVKAIPANSAILIAGGGTGQILEEISKIHSAGLQIVYVDSSQKMIERSRKRNTGNNKVVFLHKQIQEVALSQEFDVVITPFLFDNFSQSNTHFVFDKIDVLLKPQGLWLFADFQVDENNLWQKALLKMMYLFFRLTCKIESSVLPATETLFEKRGYKIGSRQTFYKKFISAIIYKKA